MQKVTGTLSGGAHPGSYNGQDAYNDMLVVEDESMVYRQRTTSPTTFTRESGDIELHARSTDSDGPERERERESYSVENHPSDSRVRLDTTGKVQTLAGRMGTGGNNTPMVMTPFRKGSHPRNPQESQTWEEAEKNDTLNAFDSSETHTPTLVGERTDMDEEKRYAVRRLTPTECERLQGFPDNWTDVGEWTDSKGKVRQTTDSARYKALGNSICLPPWKWVLKRISATYERDATLGSLFDGIGGFPLLWLQLNGPHSVLWASEIEEFCIAVTERRINGNFG